MQFKWRPVSPQSVTFSRGLITDRVDCGNDYLQSASKFEQFGKLAKSNVFNFWRMSLCNFSPGFTCILEKKQGKPKGNRIDEMNSKSEGFVVLTGGWMKTLQTKHVVVFSFPQNVEMIIGNLVLSR